MDSTYISFLCNNFQSETIDFLRDFRIELKLYFWKIGIETIASVDNLYKERHLL